MRVSKDLPTPVIVGQWTENIPFRRGKRFFLRFSKVSPQFYRYKVTRELELKQTKRNVLQACH